MKPNARAVVLFLGHLSLAQAAARRRHGMLDRVLAERAADNLEKRQDQGAATVTVLQTVTVGAADAGVVANNTVTVTVTANSGAAPVTVTVCPPGQALGAAQSSADVGGPPGAGAAVSPPGAAVPGVPDVPTGGIGVQIIAVPTELRTPSKVVAAPPTPTAAPNTPPAVQNPAASLQPLPGDANAASSLQPLPGASNAASSLQPLPGASDITSSLQPLPTLPASSLQQLPGTANLGVSSAAGPSLQPLPSAPAITPPAAALPSATAPAAGLDSTVNLGAPIPGGAAATPIAGPGGSFGGEVGAVPIPGGEAPPAAAQPAVDPAVTVAPDVAAGAQVNIDVSGLTLNSQLNLGNLVQASPAPVPT